MKHFLSDFRILQTVIEGAKGLIGLWIFEFFEKSIWKIEQTTQTVHVNDIFLSMVWIICFVPGGRDPPYWICSVAVLSSVPKSVAKRYKPLNILLVVVWFWKITGSSSNGLVKIKLSWKIGFRWQFGTGEDKRHSRELFMAMLPRGLKIALSQLKLSLLKPDLWMSWGQVKLVSVFLLV